MITIEQAKSLSYGDILHHTINKNADGTPQRWKVNGEVKTWKRNPNRIKIPVKHEMYSFGYVTENELHLVSIPE